MRYNDGVAFLVNDTNTSSEARQRCVRCGKQARAVAVFCPRCGSRLRAIETPRATFSPRPAPAPIVMPPPSRTLDYATPAPKQPKTFVRKKQTKGAWVSVLAAVVGVWVAHMSSNSSNTPVATPPMRWPNLRAYTPPAYTPPQVFVPSPSPTVAPTRSYPYTTNNFPNSYYRPSTPQWTGPNSSTYSPNDFHIRPTPARQQPVPVPSHR